MKKRYFWMNLETGELLSYSQMLREAEEMYDFDDWTNALELYEYYEKTDLEIPADFYK